MAVFISKDKQSWSVLLGAAFIMATSAVGPGFMTQTAAFTEKFGASFGFIILASIIISYIVQVNVWRIIAVSRLRGQDIANKVFPGLGYFVAFLVAFGGLAFNIGNVGGAGLGINVTTGIDTTMASAISGVLGILIFSFKRAQSAMDLAAKIFGGIMIVLIGYIVYVTEPPIAEAIHRTFVPTKVELITILTLAGGTVGGYITFAGGHRLIDAGICGEENLHNVTKSAGVGIGVDLLIRVLLFLAVLGVVGKGVSLGTANPAAEAFRLGAGETGYKIFGIVLFAAAITSVVGAAYTSVSFLKTLFASIAKYENLAIIGFISFSTLIVVVLGRPAAILILAGALNGLILPVTLGAMLLAAKRTDIVGGYQHPKYLLYAGWIIVVVTAYMGATSLQSISKLWV